MLKSFQAKRVTGCKEEIFLLVFAVSIFLAAAFTSLFETSATFLGAHANWKLNEVLTATFLLAVVLSVYAAGRTLQQRRAVTKNKELCREARNTVSLLSSILDSTGDGILVVSDKGTFSLLNRRFVEMWQIPEHIVETRDDDKALEYVCDQLKHPEGFLDKVRELYDQPETESLDTLEFKDGRVFNRYSRPHRVEDKIVGRVWSFYDVTDKRRSEELAHRRETELWQSQKLEAVGQLAGGVAHDFNNLLMVILGHGEFLKRNLAGHPPLEERANEIQKAAERAASLTRQLLLFSRKQTLKPKILDFNELISEMNKMLVRLLPETIRLRFVPEPGLGFLRADPVHIEQVVMNLVLNARDAMPTGGEITVETTQATLNETGVQKNPGTRPGPHAVLTITDTGQGMDHETQTHIFEPFFTTKGQTDGTGLGLSVVYGIIKQSGGNITVESEPGKGTKIKVFLPIVEKEESPKEPWSDIVEIPPGSHTILVVEDEEPVRAIVCDVLGQHGYTVLDAQAPEQALQIARKHGGPIHMTLTDVVMPDMNGRELARRIREIHPETTVLFMSGYSSDALGNDGNLEDDTVLLEKPVLPIQLLQKVYETLNAVPS